MNRNEAKQLLLRQDSPTGTFLVRISDNIPDGFAYSMRNYKEGKGPFVGHFKIQRCADQRSYSITIKTRGTYATLPELVAAVSSIINTTHRICRYYFIQYVSTL